MDGTFTSSYTLTISGRELKLGDMFPTEVPP